MMDVMIAEDENIVRLGLSALFNWEENGFNVCGLFKNGKEAYDFLQDHHVDIIITDIKMPVMDGEELIRKVREQNKTVDILIISNFDDFAIVKNCFKMGISDYILKQEIEPKNFLRILNEVAARRNVDSVSERKGEAPCFDSALFFADLVECNYNLSSGLFVNKHGTDLDRFLSKRFFVAGFELISSQKDRRYHGLPTQLAAIRESILHTCREFFEDTAVLGEINDGKLIIWIDKDEELRLEDWNNRLQKILYEYFNIVVRIGISQSGGMNELAQLAAESDNVKRRLFYYHDKKYLQYGGHSFDFLDGSALFDNIKEIRLSLEYNNIVTIKESLYLIFETLKRQKNIDPEKAADYIKTICAEYDYFLIQNMSAGLCDIVPQWKENLENMYSLDQFAEYMLRLTEELKLYLIKNEEHYELIAKAKLIVSKQYSDQEMSLAYVAGLLNVNPAYFSTLFKKRTGTNFIQYLTSYRISQSIQLLQNEKLSVEEIAYRTGYQNSNYFVKVFKKTTGKTISEFRHGI